MKLLSVVFLVLINIKAIGQSRHFHGDWHCKGTKSVTTEVTPTGVTVKNEDSKDEIWLTRRGSFLLLQINPREAEIYKPSLRQEMQKPELFKISGETSEGVTATHVPSMTSTAQHTFIWRADHSRALLTETVFSFFPPQGEPLNSTIAFFCIGAN